MILAVPTETCPGERRVALVPGVLAGLLKAGLQVRLEAGAGREAGIPDEAFAKAGAQIVGDRKRLLVEAEVVVQVRTPGANPEAGLRDLELLRPQTILMGCGEPLTAHAINRLTAEKGLALLSVELLPRITRAQSMDVLSSQANLAGYKAVLMAANALPRIFPMMMTPAGTLRPAKVFVVGAGVAGLQAIATAKRLGAAVSATDVRAAVRQEVESLGARFVAPAELAEGSGGYAKELSDQQQQRQQEIMAQAVAASDVVITTAAVPGRKAPVLVTEAMVRAMAPGSVIVDMAAERGGNCALTEPGRVVVKHGVTLIGTTNLPAGLPHDASVMYGGNLSKLLLHLVKDGKIVLDPKDEITAGILVCRDGQIVHPAVRQAMGMGAEGLVVSG